MKTRQLKSRSSRYPGCPDSPRSHTYSSTIEYVINLHQHHELSLALAYRKATSDFVRLRAINEMAQFAAEQEAVYYGASWKKSAFVSPAVRSDWSGTRTKTLSYLQERFFDLEEKALDSLSSTPAAQSNTATSTSRAYRPTFAPTFHKRRQWVPQVSSDRTAAKNGKEFTGGLAYVTAWADVQKAEQVAREKEQVHQATSSAAAGSESVVPEPASAQVQQEVPVSSQ